MAGGAALLLAGAGLLLVGAGLLLVGAGCIERSSPLQLGSFISLQKKSSKKIPITFKQSNLFAFELGLSFYG